MSKEAMKLALEALKANYELINGSGNRFGLEGAMDGYYSGCFDVKGTNKKTNAAIKALEEALANQEQGWTSERIAGVARLKDAQDKKLALAKQEQGEPVEWGVDWGKDGNSVSIIKRLADGGIEVLAWEYAPHPQQRTWVGLTIENIVALFPNEFLHSTYDTEKLISDVRIVEAKLKQKNI